MITIYSEIIESKNTASKVANDFAKNNVFSVTDKKVYAEFKKLIDADLSKLDSIQWLKEKTRP